MAFVVNSAEWNFDGQNAASIAHKLDQLLERIAIIKERKELIWIGDDLQTRPIFAGLDLWSLYSPDSPISLPPEIWQELTSWLLTVPRYADEDWWPPGMEFTEIQIDGDAAEDNPDVAWAHHNVRAGRPVGCLGIDRSGQHQTKSIAGEVPVYWITDEASHRQFWRAAIVLEGDNEESLVRRAQNAFPDLYFPDRLWRGLSRLEGGYRPLRFAIRNLLSRLDDFGAWAFTFPPPALAFGEPAGDDPTKVPSKQIIERRFTGLHLDVAPENPNVRQDNDCRREREIDVRGRTIYCEWHVKLEPHRNRIHIHAPIPESNNKLIVAIICDHLLLP